MKKKCETIIFKRAEYETTEELFKRVGKQLELLLEEGYLAVVRYDEPGLGIVVIEFNHDDHFDPWGGYMPVWLNEEEEEEFCCLKYKEENEEDF